MRLNQLARKLNIAPEAIINYLKEQKIEIVNNPNTKLLLEQVALVQNNFTLKKKLEQKEEKKIESSKKSISSPRIVLDTPRLEKIKATSSTSTTEEPSVKKLDKPAKKLTILGKINIASRSEPKKKVAQFLEEQKKKRRDRAIKNIESIPEKKTPKITNFTPSSTSKKVKKNQHKEKFDIVKRRTYREQKQERYTLKKKKQNRNKILKVTEFISPSELAPLLDVPVSNLIDICMSFGMEVSIGQRLNKEAISMIAEELGQKIEFVTLDEKLAEEEEPSNPEDLQSVAPIVTIMGHVDHGKTSLLDYIRKTKIIKKEAGGITQHIGAYDVKISNGQRIVFLDTPGHEAFTAMRARGIHLTNIAIIIIAANSGVKPQTKEAISHAQMAGTPIVIAINKIDQPGAEPDQVKSQLSDINILVEDWGGKYQCQEISAKTGAGVDELLEKVILEAEILELKANPKRKAKGIIIEAALKKGKGYVATMMVQEGTLHRGDILVAGPYSGKVKAIFTAEGRIIPEAGPATPVQILGLDGAPPAGQVSRAVSSDKEARNIASRYRNILHEQRLGSEYIQVVKKKKENIFKEDESKVLFILIKSDVTGSNEVLTDSLVALTNSEVEIKVIYKAVGPVIESDILLAATSKALVVAFNTNITPEARQAQKKEGISIISYDVIYKVIDDVKKIMTDLHKPQILEPTIIGIAEVRKIFKISRIGTIAGCYVKEGTIKRNENIKILRGETIIYNGPIKQLKREKEIIKEAKNDTECGISTDGFNEIEVGDIIQSISLSPQK